MSYSVSAYVVDLAKLGRRLAARDLTLLDGIESDAQDLDDDLDDDTPSTVEHGRRIVLGQATAEGNKAKYGYSFKFICEQIGSWQDGSEWSSISGAGEWFDSIDEGLAKAGCQVSISKDLIYSGPPIELPTPDDFPVMGHVPPSRIPAMLSELGKALPSLPPRHRRAIAQVVAWLEAAREQGLVLFEC